VNAEWGLEVGLEIPWKFTLNSGLVEMLENVFIRVNDAVEKAFVSLPTQAFMGMFNI
jgi:hypothetical protein